MEGTLGADCNHRAPFGVSPNGRWLLFAEQSGQLVLVDFESGARQTLEIDTEARARIEGGRPPDLQTLCWSVDGTEAVLQGPALPSPDPTQPRRPNIFSLPVGTAVPTLGVRASAECVSRPGRAWDLWTQGRPVSPGSGRPAGLLEPEEPDPTITRGSRVLQGPEERRARILDPEGRTLVDVRPPRFAPLGAGALITSFAWSPDGSRLAWVSSRTRAGTWGGRSRIHVREADGASRVLGPANAGAANIAWASDSALLACLPEDPGRIVRLEP
ncbi:MAG: PD40 domain-containing protein [Gammaproteobacteria bacterium]|nr:PD40 domain-containing protein [Gammaproteobacteria bacterium]